MEEAKRGKGQKKRSSVREGMMRVRRKETGGDDKKIWIRKEQMIERNDSMWEKDIVKHDKQQVQPSWHEGFWTLDNMVRKFPVETKVISC